MVILAEYIRKKNVMLHHEASEHGENRGKADPRVVPDRRQLGQEGEERGSWRG